MRLLTASCASPEVYVAPGDPCFRWLASALLDSEPRLRRIRGYKHLPRLREAIQRELGLLDNEANERSVA